MSVRRDGGIMQATHKATADRAFELFYDALVAEGLLTEDGVQALRALQASGNLTKEQALNLLRQRGAPHAD